jgi:hypothetical protein
VERVPNATSLMRDGSFRVVTGRISYAPSPRVSHAIPDMTTDSLGTRSGARYELHLTVYSRSVACIAVGVLRAVRISTSVPIAVDSITAGGLEG